MFGDQPLFAYLNKSFYYLLCVCLIFNFLVGWCLLLLPTSKQKKCFIFMEFISVEMKCIFRDCAAGLRLYYVAIHT